MPTNMLLKNSNTMPLDLKNFFIIFIFSKIRKTSVPGGDVSPKWYAEALQGVLIQFLLVQIRD